jgi:hypothetical protein
MKDRCKAIKIMPGSQDDIICLIPIRHEKPTIKFNHNGHSEKHNEHNEGKIYFIFLFFVVIALEAVGIYMNNLFMALSGCNFVSFFCYKYSIMAAKTFLVSL